MTTQRLGILSLATFVLLASQQIATAQPETPDTPNPERIARRCVESINQIADRCVAANVETAHQCIRRINALLEAGDREGAREVARRCLNAIATRSDTCVDEIHERCRRCIRLLLRLDEPQLARRVANACEDAVEDVRRSQRRTSNAIRSQFDDE